MSRMKYSFESKPEDEIKKGEREGEWWWYFRNTAFYFI